MKHSLKDGSGYLIIDHSESPGLTESEVPLQLRDTVVGPNRVGEWDIQFCAHCGTRVILNPDRTRPRGYCAKCDHYICDNPVCNKECKPIKKLFDRAETAIYRGDDPLILLTD